jgi:hypothetical protein
MSHPDPHAAATDRGESLLDLLSSFFPSTGEVVAFVGGILLGTGILGVLVALALLINGHIGIWPSF